MENFGEAGTRVCLETLNRPFKSCVITGGHIMCNIEVALLSPPSPQDLRCLHHLLPAGPHHVHASPLCWLPASPHERAHGSCWCLCSPQCLWSPQVSPESPHDQAVPETVCPGCYWQCRAGVPGCGAAYLPRLCGSLEWQVLLSL